MKNIVLNIACLGAGNHAFKNTLPVLKNHKKFKLVGVYLRNIKKNFSRINELECKVSDDLNKILKIKNLNAVYISSQPSLHYIQARKALLSNKHVIVEKPAVINLSQAKKLCSLANKKKLVVMEGFMYKYHKQFSEILKLLKKNKKKKIKKITSTFGFPHLDRSDFRYNFKAGGGALLDAGSYVISFIRILSKNKIILKNANISKKNFDVDVKGSANFESIDGSKYDAKWYFGYKYKNEISIKYPDIKIIVKRAFSKPKNLITFIELFKKNKLTKKIKIKKDNHFNKMFNHFFKCCFTSDLRLNENYELLQQAKVLNKVLLESK